MTATVARSPQQMTVSAAARPSGHVPAVCCVPALHIVLIVMTTSFESLGFLFSDSEEFRASVRSQFSVQFGNVESASEIAIAELNAISGNTPPSLPEARYLAAPGSRQRTEDSRAIGT